MTDGSGSAETPQEGENELDIEKSDKLKLLGFDPNAPVYEVSAPFDEELIRRALFGSTYSSPVVLPFVIEVTVSETEESWPCPMVVELVQAVYGPYQVRISDVPLGCYSKPEWYVRGYFFRSAFDPYPELIRMHAWIQRADDEGPRLDVAYIQVVRPAQEQRASDDRPLRLGHGAPGQP